MPLFLLNALNMQLPAYLAKKRFHPGIERPPSPALQLVVTIPCYNEPHLLLTLKALWRCKRPDGATEVIVVINEGIQDSAQVKAFNRKTFTEARQWAEAHQDAQLRFHILYKTDIPPKKAGVGYARQLAMDEAYYRLVQAGHPRGIITGFDADSSCAANYLREIFSVYKTTPKTTGTSIYFEHPLEGTDYEEKIYRKILDYELYLRYYRLGLFFTGFPYAFHTLGSSFSVRADVYAKQGGMNQRKAGEDFYFLHKIIPLGNFQELNSTVVYPSPRPSKRVPFGTGAAIRKMLDNPQKPYLTYNPHAFAILRQFLRNYPKLLYHSNWQEILPAGQDGVLLQNFLIKHQFPEAYQKIRVQSPDPGVFHKRFFQWFTAFRILKFMNFAHAQALNYQPIAEAARTMLSWCGHQPERIPNNKKALLLYYRETDRSGKPGAEKAAQ